MTTHPEESDRQMRVILSLRDTAGPAVLPRSLIRSADSVHLVERAEDPQPPNGHKSCNSADMSAVTCLAMAGGQSVTA
jgi:hypothetical protein